MSFCQRLKENGLTFAYDSNPPIPPKKLVYDSYFLRNKRAQDWNGALSASRRPLYLPQERDNRTASGPADLRHIIK